MKRMLLTSLFVSILGAGAQAKNEPPPPPAQAASAGASSVSALIEQLKSPDAGERLNAVESLGALGPKAKDAVPALVVALNETAASDHPAVRQAARQVATSIQRINPNAVVPAETIARFTKRAAIAPAPRRIQGGTILSCPLQTDAIETLAILGPAAKSAVPDLIRLSHKPCIQPAIRQALSAIGSPNPDQITPLVQALRDPDVNVRLAVVEYAKNLPPETAGLIPAVGRLLNDSSPAVRLAALESLEKLHPEGEARLPLVREFLKDPSKDIRERALHVVDAMGDDARSATPLLEDMLKDPEPGIRLEAARLLVKLDARNEKARESLIALSADPDSDIGLQAAAQLRALQPSDARIARALAPYAQKDRRERVQQAWSNSTAQQRQANSRTMRIQAIKMATDILNGEPTGVRRAFPSSVGRVTCWTEVSVSTPPAVLHQVWFHNGQQKSDQTLEIIEATDRVWSSQPVKAGKWRVEIRANGWTEPLATAAFTVWDESAAPAPAQTPARKPKKK
jgi:HEAT repeat protein